MIRRADVLAFALAFISLAGLVLFPPPALADVPGRPLIANGSFESPQLDAWSGSGAATIGRTGDASFHAAHALAVESSGLPGSGVVTNGQRESRAGTQLMTLAVKGTDSSVGKVVRAVVVDPATGLRTSSAPVHLTAWWQTVGVTAETSAGFLTFAVEEVGTGWVPGDRYVVDQVDAAVSRTRVAEVTGRQLFVDGQPYVMYGYTYGAAPVGSLGLPGQANNALSWHTNPEHCRTDANLMRAAGVNTLRITYLDVYGETAIRCMDEFAAAGVGLLWLVNGPAGWQGTNLPAYEEGFRVQLTTVVEQVKDHPATLGYVIGNENSRTQPELQAEWFAMLDRLAAETKALAPGHLTTVSVNSQQFHPNGPWGGVGPDVAPNIDLWGYNHYGNGSGYPDALWQRIIDQDPSRPVWMSEFGTDRYRCAQDPDSPKVGTVDAVNFVTCLASGSYEDQQPQADWDVAQWQDIAANLSVHDPAGAMVGGTLFMWSDMWWFSFPIFTGSAPTPLTHDVTGLAGTNQINGQPNGFIRSHFPDQHFSPEWIGVGHTLRVDQTGPRVTALAYDAMATQYTGVAGPRVTGPSVSSAGGCAATLTWSTDVPTFAHVDYGRVLVVQQGDMIVADNTIADQVVQATTATTAHEVTLTGLTPATTYRVHVRGFTESGRSGTAPGVDFTTAAAPDTTCGP